MLFNLLGWFRLHPMFSRLFKRRSAVTVRLLRRNRRHSLAMIEGLEPRVVLSNIVISSNTSWGSITAGSGVGGLPTSADTITVNSGATLTVNVANAVSGALTDAGSLVVSNTYGVTLGSLAGAGGVSLGTTTSISVGVDNTSTTYSGVISGSGIVTKQGSGTWTVTGASTYTGTTTIAAGTLSVNASVLASTNGPLGNTTSAVILGDSTTAGVLAYAGTSTTDGFKRGFTVNSGGGGITNTTANMLSVTTAGIAATGTLTLNAGGTGNIAFNNTAIISGAGGVTVNSAGTGGVFFSNVNTYTGATSINKGYLTAASGTLPDASAVVLANVSGAILNLSGNETIGSLTGGGTTGGNVTLNYANILTIGADNTSPAAYAGVISGTGSLVKSGTGTLTLSGASTYTGTTTINAGTLSAGVISGVISSNLGNATSAIVLGSLTTAGTLAYAGAAVNFSRGFTVSAGGGGLTNATANALTVSGAIANAGPFTLSANGSGGISVSSVISGAGSLIVNNAGTGEVTLSGANTYTGTTTINAGTVNASSIVVAADASNLGNATTPVVLGGAGSTTAILSYTGAAATFSRGLTVNSGGTNSSFLVNTTANALTVSGGITVAGGMYFSLNNNSTGGIAVSGVISGAGSVVANGSGVVTLSGANTYSGLTQVYGGTLSASSIVVATSASNLGNATSAVGLYGGNLSYTGAAATFTRGFALSNGGGSVINTTSNLLTISGGIGSGGQITLNAASTGGITVSGVISGTTNVSVSNSGSGTGVVTLSAANTYTGTTTVNASTLILAYSGTSPASLAGNISVASGGMLQLGAASSGGLTVSGVISGAGNVVVNSTGTGVVTLSGANTYTGTTTISAGTVSVGTIAVSGGASSLGNATSVVTLGSVTMSGTITYTGATDTFTRGFTVNAGGGGLTNTTANLLTVSTGITNAGPFTLSATSSGGVLVSNVISGAGALIVNSPGTGQVTLSATNTYTGTTTISAGRISASSIAVSGGASSLGNATSVVVLGGASTAGTLSYTGAGESFTRGFTVGAGGATITNTTANLVTVATGGIAAAGPLTLGAASTGGITVTSVVSGVGALVVNNAGSGVVTLSGANTYTGTTTVSAGTLSVSSVVVSGGASNLGNATSPVVLGTTNTAGTLAYTGSDATYVRGLTVNAGGGTISSSANNFIVGPTGGVSVASGGTLTLVSNTNLLHLKSVISGAGSVAIAAATGDVVFYGSNTYTGSTTVYGHLYASDTTNNNAIPDASAVIMANALSSTLYLYNSETIGSLTGGGTSGGNVNLFTYTLSVGSDNTSPAAYAGVISGAGNLVKVGSGTFTPSGANTYTGTTTITGGALSASSIVVSGGASNLGNATSAILINGAASLTYTGDTATFTRGLSMTSNYATLINSSTKLLTVSGNISNSALGYLGGTGNITVTGVISGAGQIALGGPSYGPGVVTLAGANTFTGLFWIRGTVSVETLVATAGSSNLGNGTGVVNLDGGILSYTGAAASYTRGFTVTANGGTLLNTTANLLTVTTAGVAATGTLTLNAAGAGNIAFASTAIISGAGGVTVNSAGTGGVFFNNANTYTGTTTINAGYLTAASGTLPDASAVVLANVGGATLNLSGNETIGSLSGGAVGSAVVLGANTLTVGADNTSPAAFAGVISGTGSLVKSGTGVLTLSGTNTYTGTTTISAGTLTASVGSALPDASAVTLANVSGATLNLASNETIASLAGGGTTGGTVTLGANSLTVGGANTSTTFAGVISGTGNLTKTGTGTLTLSGANTYTGTTTISAGTLTASGGSALPDASAVLLLDTSGASLNLATSETIGSLSGGGSTGGTITLGANTLTVGANNTSPAAYAGVISGTGSLVKSGTGTFTPSGANTYTGTTTITGGILSASIIVVSSGASNLGNATSAVVFNGSGNLTYTGDTATFTRGFSIPSANGTLTNATANLLTVSGTISDSGWFWLNANNAGNISVSGVVSGTGGIVVGSSGSGVVTLSGANTYTNSTQIYGGTLSVDTMVVSGGASNLGNATSAVNLNGGALSYTGAAASFTRGFTVTASGGMLLNTTANMLTVTTTGITATGTLTLNAAGAGNIAFTSTAIISGTGDVTVNSAGTGGVFFNNANTYTGTTTINKGYLTAASGTLPDASAVVLANASGATLNLSGNETIGSLSGGGSTGGTVTLNYANILTIGADNTSPAAFAGVISGTGSLVKSGTGTLTLSGANTYTGTTSISTGTLSAGVISGFSSSNLGNATSAVILGTSTTVGTLAYTGAAGTLSRSLTVSAGGGGLTNTTANALTVSAAIANAGPFTLSTTGAGGIAVSSVISGVGSLIVNSPGTGEVTLSGANTYTGTTTISQGTLSASTIVVAAGASNLGNTTTPVVLGGSGATASILSYTGSAATFTRGLTVSAGGLNNAYLVNATANALTVSGGITVASGIYFWLNNNSTGSITASGVISGGGSVIAGGYGSGLVTLSGANTYTGLTQVYGGTLAASSIVVAAGSSNLGNATSAVGLYGGNLSYSGTAANLTRGFDLQNGGGSVVNTTANLLTVSGRVNTLSISAQGRIDLNAASTGGIAVSGVISGTTNLSVSSTGTGMVTLTGANTYTGTTTVTSGELDLNSATGTAVGGNLVVGDGLGTDLVKLLAANQLSDTATVTLKTGSTLNLGTFSDTIGALNGVGTVSSTTGTLTATTGLNPGGASSGILNTGNLVLVSTATVTVNLNGTTPGTGYSQANVTGTVDLGLSTLVVNLGAASAIGSTYTIINNDGTDAVVGNFAGLAEGATYTDAVSGQTFSISYHGGTGNDVVLTTLTGGASTTSVTAAASATYGQSLTFTATVSPSMAINAVPGGTVQFQVDGTNVGGVVTLVNGTASLPYSLLHAGSHSITAIYGGDTRFGSSTGTPQAITIGKAHLTVTAEPQSKTYDGQTFTGFTASYSGLLNGDALGGIGLNGAASFSGTATTAKNVGTWTITPGAGNLTANDYDFTIFVGGMLTIDKAHLSVTADAKTKTYDGLVFTPFTATVAGFVNNETLATSGVTGTASFTGAVTTAKNAGTYGTITPALGTLAATNYDFTTFTSGTLTINKAHLSVTADAQSKTYDGQAFTSFTVTLAGFVNNETLATSGVTGTASFSGTATTGVNSGNYAVTPATGTLAATNYDFTTFTSGTLTINKAHLSVSANAQTKTYDGQIFSPFTATLAGFVNNETLATSGVTGTASFSGVATTAKNAGLYGTITPAQGTLAATNYDFTTFTSGTLTINKAHLSVTADNQSKPFDGQVFTAFTATLAGFVNNENLANSGVTGAASFSGTATTGVDKGNYPITPGQGTLAATNYDFTIFSSGTLNVGVATLTITAKPQSKTYGTGYTLDATQFTTSGLLNGDTVGSVTLSSLGSTATAAAGSYAITPSAVTGGTFSPSNYAILYSSGTLTVNQAPLTITANNQSKTYGQTVSFGSGSTLFSTNAGGLKNGDTIGKVTLSVSNSGGNATASVVASPYTITPSDATGGTFNASNYLISYATGTFTVTPAHLTVTADNQTKTYDGSPADAFSASLIGFVNGEKLASSGVTGTASFTGSALTGIDLGNYTIVPGQGTLASSNYDFTTFTSGTLTIVANTGGSGAVDPHTVNAGGLSFYTSGTFTSSGSVYTTAGLVQVGFVPATGQSLVPLVELLGTVTLNSSSLTFAATGGMNAVVTGTPSTLVNQAIPSSSITALVGAGIQVDQGATLTVAAASFQLSSIALHSATTPEIWLQGSISLGVATVAVDGQNHVTESATGVNLTGVNASLASNSLSLGSLNFSTSSLTVAYTSATSTFAVTGAATVNIQGLGTVKATLGGGATHGLVFTAGSLASFDATVSLDATLAGGSLTAQGITLSYVAAAAGNPEQFTQSGTVTFTFGSDQKVLSLALGTANSPGLVIENGTLKSLNGTATASNWTIAGGSFNANANVVYAAAAGTTPETLTVTGAASEVFGSGSSAKSLSLSLGGSGTAGLVISSGKLTSLNAAATASNWTIAGGNFNATATVTYAAAAGDAPETLTVTGAASEVFGTGSSAKSLSLVLGGSGTAGLVLSNGALTSLNATAIASNWTIAGGSFNATATVVYAAAAGATPETLTITGNASQVFGSGVSAKSLSLVLGGNGTTGLVLSNGQLTSLNAVANASSWTIAGGSFNANATVVYAAAAGATPESLTITGAASEVFGSGASAKSLSLVLGGNGTAGLVLSNGQLTSLNATATASNWTIAGGNFNANATVVYAAAAGSTPELFTLTGAASEVFGSGASAKSLSLVLGGSGTAGLVLSNGALTSLNATATASNWTIAGGSFNANATVVYAAAAGSTPELFTLTGGASEVFGSGDSAKSLSLTLGGSGTAGMVLRNGQLTSLNATAIASNWTIAGGSFNATATVVYAAAAGATPETLTVTGAASEVFGSGSSAKSLSLVLGGDSTAGLVLSNGQLTSLNATATASNWTIAGGTFNANATVVYAAAAGTTPETLTVTGGASEVFGSGSSAKSLSLVLGGGGTAGLVISSGKLTSLNATATAANWIIAGGTFNATTTVVYAAAAGSTPETLTVTGSASLVFGSGTSAKSLGLLLGSPAVAATATSPAIPATTGLIVQNNQLTSLNAQGTISNWSVGGMTINATALVTYAAAQTSPSSPEMLTVTGTASVASTALGTIQVLLGTTATSTTAGTTGLILRSGQVDYLDMTLNSNITTSGLTFSTTGLRMVYDRIPATFTLTGASSFSFRSNTIGVVFGGSDTLNGVTTTTAGLVLTNGSLTALDMTVKSAITVGSLTFNADHLRFTQSTVGSNQLFTMSGTSSFTAAGLGKVSVLFGSVVTATVPATKGLVLTNGSLTSLDMTLDTDINVSRVNITTRGLRFTYVDATALFTLAGSASATVGGMGNLSVLFGYSTTTAGVTTTTPGLVVQNGSLVNLDMTVKSHASVGAVDFDLNGMRFQYTKATDLFAMTGTASLYVGGINGLSVRFGHGSSPGLVVANGNLMVLDATVNASFVVSSVTFGVQDLEFKYTNTSQAFSSSTNTYTGTYDSTKYQFAMTGTGYVTVGGMAQLSVSFGHGSSPGLVIINGNLQSLDLTVNASFVVSSVSFGAQNLEFLYQNTSQFPTGTSYGGSGIYTGTYDTVNKTYSSASYQFVMSGTAYAAVGGMAQLSVTFGHGSTPGLVISNGNLESLDVTVNAEFAVSSVTFGAQDLEFTYQNLSQITTGKPYKGTGIYTDAYATT